MFMEEVFWGILRKVIFWKMGVWGFWLILEDILLDMMFDFFVLDGVEEVVVNGEVVDGGVCLLYIYVEWMFDVESSV